MIKAFKRQIENNNMEAKTDGRSTRSSDQIEQTHLQIETVYKFQEKIMHSLMVIVVISYIFAGKSS